MSNRSALSCQSIDSQTIPPISAMRLIPAPLWLSSFSWKIYFRLKKNNWPPHLCAHSARCSSVLQVFAILCSGEEAHFQISFLWGRTWWARFRWCRLCWPGKDTLWGLLWGSSSIFSCIFGIGETAIFAVRWEEHGRQLIFWRIFPYIAILPNIYLILSAEALRFLGDISSSTLLTRCWHQRGFVVWLFAIENRSRWLVLPWIF